jgi:hypothetical protein
MQKILSVFALVAAVVLPFSAEAAGTQVRQSSFRAAGATGHVYGRSDGLYQDSTTYGPWLIEDGTASKPLGKSYYEDFSKYGASKGIFCIDSGDGSTCAGDATTVPGLLTMGDGLKLIQFPVVTATLPVTMAAAGLDITGDLTDNDGFEVTGGVLGATGTPFIVGDDPAFYFCATIKLPDVDGTDEFMAGFRRAEPFQAVMQSYADYAAIGDVSGDIKTETEVNGGGTTTTDTTANWADGETHVLCTYVTGPTASSTTGGVVTYKLDGATPATVAAFTFDDGDPVVPYIYLRHDANIAEATIVTKWEVGYQP